MQRDERVAAILGWECGCARRCGVESDLNRRRMRLEQHVRNCGLASEIRPLALSGNGGTPLVEVALSGPSATPEALSRLDAILRAHPGNAAWRLRLQLPDGKLVTIAPAASRSVAPDEALRKALEAEFGAGCLTLR